jgi:hypothetical protein
MFLELQLGQNSILTGNKRAFTDDLLRFIDPPNLSALFEAVENDFFADHQ